jgi:hypothetical protein
MMSQDDVTGAFEKTFAPTGKASVFISSSNSPQQAQLEKRVISAAEGFLSSPQHGTVVKVWQCMCSSRLSGFLTLLAAAIIRNRLILSSRG